MNCHALRLRAAFLRRAADYFLVGQAQAICFFAGEAMTGGSLGYSPSFLKRLFTSLKWKSREQSFSSSPFLKCFATAGSD